MARSERLPKGFWRSPAGSLRVQVRVKGHGVEVKSFPLFSDTPSERREQRTEAEAWALETRRRIIGGTHASTKQAEKLTLADALLRYERDKLDPENSNHRKDVNRIRAIIADSIACRSVASLKPTDIVAYRDDLIHRGWLASVAAATARARVEKAPKARLDDLALLKTVPGAIAAEEDPVRRRRLVQRREAIEAREAVKQPARTTISNKIQLVTRALGHLAETVTGVPDLTGTAMPPATPGRERRLRAGELKMLLGNGDDVLPIAVELAIETTLRKERLLELAPRHVVEIGGGRSVIMFPKEQRRRKRTGIVPVTPVIRKLLDRAVSLGGGRDPERSYLAVNGNTFDHRWRQLVLACDIDDLHFHDLRHEGTSRLFERGLTTAEVMSITGHSTQEMVDRYSHYSASLVHDKLVGGSDTGRIDEEIIRLFRQFLASKGDFCSLITTMEQIGRQSII